MNRGKLLILFMLGISVAVTGFAIWYRHSQSDRVLQRMSPNVAALIAYAPQAEIQQVVPEKNAPQGIQPTKIIRAQGQSFWVVQAKNVGDLKEFTTVRGWLVHNDNFDWSQPPDGPAGPWQYGMQFSNGNEQAQLLFDIAHCRMLLLPEGAELNPRPMIDGLKSFFAEQFPAAEK